MEQNDRPVLMTLSEIASLCLIVASGICAGIGTSSFWIGASVVLGLKAIYQPPR